MKPPRFLLFDERALDDEDEALVCDTAESHEQAVERAERLGFPTVIIGPEGRKEHYVPKDMRGAKK